jgi:hypothetical protein
VGLTGATGATGFTGFTGFCFERELLDKRIRERVDIYTCM